MDDPQTEAPVQEAVATPQALPPDRIGLLRRHGMEWTLRLLVLWLLAIPAHDFLKVALSRLWFPYEVEWLEGEIAMYAIRWNEKASLSHLYPVYDTSEYVPHLYPPLYQILMAQFFKGSGTVELGWGRLISLISTLGIVAAVIAIVRERTGRWFAGVVGGLSYLMFFKASGYWYDLVRVDNLAYCLAMWSAFLIGGRRPGFARLTIGFLIAGAALATKQTAVFIPAFVAVLRFGGDAMALMGEQLSPFFVTVRRLARFLPARSPAVLCAVPAIIIALNAFLLLRDGGMFFYLLEVPKQHLIYWENIRTSGTQQLWQFYAFAVWLLPLGVWVPLLFRRWRHWWEWAIMLFLGACAAAVLVWWMVAARDLPHPGMAMPGARGLQAIGPYALRHVMSTWSDSMIPAVALAMGGGLCWCIRALIYRTRLCGAGWMVLLVAAQHIAVVTWVKIGGYVNNFIPLFAVQSVVAGLCIAWMERSLGRRWLRFLVPMLLSALIWLTWNGTREPFEIAPRVEAFYEQHRAEAIEKKTFDPEKGEPFILPQYLWLEAAGEFATPVYSQYDKAKLETWQPWIVDGLRYHHPRTPLRDRATEYGDQIPPPDATAEWDALMAKLIALKARGLVYLPHQNYLAFRAEIQPGTSVDSTRDISYLGRGTPRITMQKVERKEYQSIVLMMDLGSDWLTGDLKSVMERNYELEGVLYPEVKNPEALLPRTGARVRPTYVYRPKAASEPEPKEADAIRIGSGRPGSPPSERDVIDR